MDTKTEAEKNIEKAAKPGDIVVETGPKSRIFGETELPAMHPLVRAVLVVIFTLFGLYFLLNTLVIVPTTVMMLPAFANGLAAMPFISVVGFLIYVVSSFACGIETVLLFILAYHIARKKALKRNLIILGIITFVTLVVCYFVGLPLLSELIRWR